jgi:hypothetical protein
MRASVAMFSLYRQARICGSWNTYDPSAGDGNYRQVVSHMRDFICRSVSGVP